MDLIFHTLVQRDLRIVLRYYDEEGGPQLADRFFFELGSLLEEITNQPKKFHEVSDGLRRANIPNFPYHLLFSVNDNGIRILVLRHHRRHPRFGVSRK